MEQEKKTNNDHQGQVKTTPCGEGNKVMRLAVNKARQRKEDTNSINNGRITKHT